MLGWFFFQKTMRMYEGKQGVRSKKVPFSDQIVDFTCEPLTDVPSNISTIRLKKCRYLALWFDGSKVCNPLRATGCYIIALFLFQSIRAIWNSLI